MMKDRKWYYITAGSVIQTSIDEVNALGWRYASFEPSLNAVKHKISTIIFKDMGDDANKTFLDESINHMIDATVNIEVSQVDPKKVVRYTGAKPITNYVVVLKKGELVALYESVESKKYKDFMKTPEYAKLKKDKNIIEYEVNDGYTIQK